MILASLIVTLAFLVRGLTGFGSGLTMVPLLLLLFQFTGFAESMKLVVPTAVALAVLSGILLLSTFKTRKWIRKDVLLTMIIGAFAGVIVGTYVLASYKSDVLKRTFGVFLSLYALRMLIAGKVEKSEIRNSIGLIAGFLGGCLGGMFGTGGPPVIIYLDKKIADKRTFRATLLVYFLVVNSWQLATFAWAHLITWQVVRFTAYMLPAFVIGNVAGSALHIRINQVLFNAGIRG